jgi:hypothetical protein
MNTRTMTVPDSYASPRPRRPRPALLALVAAAVLIAPPPVARAQEATKPTTTPTTTTAPTTGPTTAPAAVPAEPPKAVVAALAAALDKGDVAAAVGHLQADDAHAAWARSTVELVKALKRLDAAALNMFGEGTGSVSQGQLHLVEAFKAVDGAQEKVEGDAATLTTPGQPQPLRLRRAGAKWVVVIAPPDPVAGERQRALYQRLVDVANRTAEEVNAGTLATPEATAKTFAARVLQARLAT